MKDKRNRVVRKREKNGRGGGWSNSKQAANPLKKGKK
jgi:hypothetical protein